MSVVKWASNSSIAILLSCCIAVLLYSCSVELLSLELLSLELRSLEQSSLELRSLERVSLEFFSLGVLSLELLSPKEGCAPRGRRMKREDEEKRKVRKE